MLKQKTKNKKQKTKNKKQKTKNKKQKTKNKKQKTKNFLRLSCDQLFKMDLSVSDKTVCMATSTVSRLASVTARDGVDTRNKDNWGSAEAVNQETTLLGGGDQTQVGQTAALEYLAPPGAEKECSAMNAYWSNYLSTADRYVKDNDSASFMWTSYDHQQAYNEREIERECRKCGGGAEMLNVFRQFYNAQVVLYKREPTEATLKYALGLLADFNKELEAQTNAAGLILQAYRAFKAPKISETGTYIAEEEDFGKCSKCDERRMGDWVDLCADCYWEEDAAIKRERRAARDARLGLAKRQNAIPSGGYTVTVGRVLLPEPEVDVTALVNRAIDMTGNPDWDAFWSKHFVSGLKIKIPKVKKPCKCGAESTTKVHGRRMCEPCADYVENVGQCWDCGVVGSRPSREIRCYECWNAYLDYMYDEDQYHMDW
jgi:hypothetical protein